MMMKSGLKGELADELSVRRISSEYGYFFSETTTSRLGGRSQIS